MPQRSGQNSALRDILQSEASGGVILIVAATAAMIIANSPMRMLYESVLHAPIGPILTPKLGPMNAHLWINDGLMAVFFLLVGLEIKRELVDGRLSNWKQRRLPFIAASAGVAVPALLYLGLTAGRAELANGWAIPAATDIAFAIGVLALLGSRAPTSLKLFLTTVAIVDDMGAVAIIAIAYTAAIDGAALFAAAATLAMAPVAVMADDDGGKKKGYYGYSHKKQPAKGHYGQNNKYSQGSKQHHGYKGYDGYKGRGDDDRDDDRDDRDDDDKKKGKYGRDG